MTMYLPNRDVRPIGQDAAEFIDAHRVGGPGDRRPDETAPRPAPVDLDPQTRLDIAHWAEEYISRLVEDHRGGRDQVRAVIHDLYRQASAIDAHEGATS
jgi:hypothetical protein